MKVYSFPRGGISFNDPTIPQGKTSETAYLPILSIIPLIQHSGENTQSLVSVGDTVYEGMLIGKGINPGTANIHASVPGKLIQKINWNNSEGLHNKALLIRMEGSFNYLGKKEEVFLRNNLIYRELHQTLSDCGIVEMEGTDIPVCDTLDELQKTGKMQTLVVRCVFDDPWLAADYALCKERMNDIVEASFIVAKACGKFERVIFAVSKPEKEIGLQMLALAGQYKFTSSMILTGSKYPQRNKRELELVLKDYARDENFNLGQLLILGPATLAAIHDAVKFHKPILERYVALGGSAVRTPCIMRVRIGKRIGDLIEECGGFINAPETVIAGSPFSGKKIVSLDEPVTKSTYAICAMVKAQNAEYLKQDCIACGDCRTVCPVGFDPEELFKHVMIYGETQYSGTEICHGCGCCDLVCPSHLPLSDTIMGLSKGKQNG